ncbi:MAG: FAD-dependent oxidoreductase [Dehalococcoidia bacterium]|jgi:NADPH-dependent 2,4-dienoyl-CoA reductase/sulfur reductase-like enzyme
MEAQEYAYVIIGGGLTGSAAVDGIREVDGSRPILLIGGENHLPYDRPPLSKKLWFGQKTLEQIFVHDRDYYESNGVALSLGTRVETLDAAAKTIVDDSGREYRYEKLLLATGGVPRSLPFPGANLEGICYYRYLDDYLRIRGEATDGKKALVVGGGFIGSELTAALTSKGVDVTMIFPTPYICDRVFPPYLGKAIQKYYREHGVTVLNGDAPVSFSRAAGRYLTETQAGRQIHSDIVIVGIGIVPETALARSAGLEVGNGIVVNEYLQSSDPDIYAAGDNAFFPYQALGQRMRIEHWDNAISQGKWAGRNMAGAHEEFTYMPYFFSDLFEFGYEAVGEVDSQLETSADWQKENDTGVIYYLRDGTIRGMMMCNVWDKVEKAREIIRAGRRVTADSLHGVLV